MVGFSHGFNLFTPFFADIKSVNWAGQFNVDFSSYLLLSALWVAWREQFSAKGIISALVASVFGIMFLAPYLLIATIVHKGDIKKVLIGKAV